jgi:hypothetical protein
MGTQSDRGSKQGPQDRGMVYIPPSAQRLARKVGLAGQSTIRAVTNPSDRAPSISRVSRRVIGSVCVPRGECNRLSAPVLKGKRCEMRQFAWLCWLVVFLPAVLSAGQIYGSVTSGGRAVPRVGLAVTCGGSVTPGTTADDGTYRMNVPQGRCKFEVTGHQGAYAEIVSYPNPTEHNFDLVRRPDGNFELRSR